MLDLRYLTFLELAKHLNYTKAAKALNYTQPTITKHIQYIENDLNTKLVYTQGREVKLTEEGIYLRDRLYELLETIDTIKQRIEKNNKISINLGTSRTVGEYYIPNYTPLLSQNKLHFNLLVENTDTLLKALEERSIDCALISGPVFEGNGMSKLPFFQDEIILVCDSHHHLANKTIDFEDLYHQKLMIRERGSGLQQSLTITFSNMGVPFSKFNNLIYIGNIRLLKEVLYQGERIGFIYRTSAQAELDSGKLAQIHIRNLKLLQNYYLVYYDNKKARALIHQLLKYIQATPKEKAINP